MAADDVEAEDVVFLLAAWYLVPCTCIAPPLVAMVVTRPGCCTLLLRILGALLDITTKRLLGVGFLISGWPLSSVSGLVIRFISVLISDILCFLIND